MTIDERIEALTMHLELMSHTVEAMRDTVVAHSNTMGAMGHTVEVMRDTLGAVGAAVLDHDRQIGQLLTLAQAQNDRLTRLEGRR